MKASDKQSINKKIIAFLKKRYKGSVPKNDRPVLETILYAICLENSTDDQADKAFERLSTNFTDLNEIRVSSVGELEPAFEGLDAPEWKAMRVRTSLQYIFEENYAFEFESLRKKTLDLAVKKLGKIKTLTPFIRTSVLQASLGGHLIPLDDRMHRAAVWLGLVEPALSREEAGDSLKAVVRKADAPLFCHLLRQFANEPNVLAELESSSSETEEDYDLTTAVARMEELLKRKAPRKKASKRPVRKTSKKKTARKPAKTSGKKKKPATKKRTTSATKKKVKKKTTSRKSTTKRK